MDGSLEDRPYRLSRLVDAGAEPVDGSLVATRLRRVVA
jgi:hypothetical protein